MQQLLGVNVDHVATLRQARYREIPDSFNAEPDPVEAAKLALEAGADSITIHVRGDRRHLQDADALKMREQISAPINLELGNTREMLDLALRVQPEFACIVPETREEVTTEGGLDAHGGFDGLKSTVELLQSKGIKVSLFIDPDSEQIEASSSLGAEMVELHTGAFANARGEERKVELERLRESAILGKSLGLQINAGHGINYRNIRELDVVPHLSELNIGHSIVSRAVYVGFPQAVAEMRELMQAYPYS